MFNAEILYAGIHWNESPDYRLFKKKKKERMKEEFLVYQTGDCTSLMSCIVKFHFSFVFTGKYEMYI